MLLGDVLHPGGLELTGKLGAMMGLNDKDRVLDVACGRGASAVYLAGRFGCQVTGLDYGQENTAAAQARAAEEGVSHLTAFRQGDAEIMPFKDRSFDAVISECSFCTFVDKTAAAREMARVLRHCGRLGITDITVNGTLPEDIQSLLSWVACVAGAGTPDFYISELEKGGFTNFTVEDQGESLIRMVNDIRKKLMVVEMAFGLGKFNSGDFDLGEARRLAQRVLELINSGTISYTLFIARKD